MNVSNFLYGITAVLLTGCSVNLSECPSVYDPSNPGNELRLLINSHDKSYSAILVCGDSNPRYLDKFQECISSSEIVQSFFTLCPEKVSTAGNGPKVIASSISPVIVTTESKNIERTTTSPPTLHVIGTELLTTEPTGEDIHTTQTELPKPDAIPLKKKVKRPSTY
jgi:hypothetical protein